jgi:hypothetical protein
LREAVHEVGGAIERVDDPRVFTFVVQFGGSARFLGQEGVVGISFGQHFNDRLLGGLVDVGDEVLVIFLGDDDAIEVEGGAVDDSGGAAGGFDRRVEHWVHVSFSVKRTLTPTGGLSLPGSTIGYKSELKSGAAATG